MAHRFHKHELLLDENMSSRHEFPRLNGLFDVKHVRDDLNKSGLPDEEVYAPAVALKRLIVTFNARDFKQLASGSLESGVIAVSPSSFIPPDRYETNCLACEKQRKSTGRQIYPVKRSCVVVFDHDRVYHLHHF